MLERIAWIVPGVYVMGAAISNIKTIGFGSALVMNTLGFMVPAWSMGTVHVLVAVIGAMLLVNNGIQFVRGSKI